MNSRRWAIEVLPERIATRGAGRTHVDPTVRFMVRADTRDEALHIGQAHRPDLKGWVWALSEVRS